MTDEVQPVDPDEANRISEDERVARAHTAAAIAAETDMPASDAGETFATGGIVEPSSAPIIVGESGPETVASKTSSDPATSA